MEKKLTKVTLASGQVASGTVLNEAQLSAKYQIWARTKGVSEKISLACWVVNQPEKHKRYFGNEDVASLAKVGFEMTAGEIPDLTEFGDSPILHAFLS